MLKIIFFFEDEMEVEVVVSWVVWDFMDFDCGLILVVEMEECVYERSDELMVVEFNVCDRFIFLFLLLF